MAHICQHCQQIPKFFDYKLKPAGWIGHHASFSELLKSSCECHMCALIVKAFRRADITEETAGPNRISLEYDYIKLVGAGFSASTSQHKSQTIICVPTDTEDNSQRPYRTTHGIWMNEHASDSVSRLDIVKKWLEDCTESHSRECVAPNDVLPTRILQFGDDSSQLRLVETRKERGLYATLSHCWGGIIPLRLTKNSLRIFTKGFATTDLPKTFQDAIKIAQYLGLNYLWNSLCIIQDDRKDWEVEAAKMAAVYQNSYITIAAVSSVNSAGGCFQPYEPTRTIEFLPVPDEPTPRFLRFRVRVVSSEAWALQRSPLYSRAWTLQEIVLSPRILLCCEDQFFWQCQSYVYSEDSSVWVERRFSDLPLTTEYGVHDNWWRWVARYSCRNLTKDDDKLAALAGLVSFAAGSSTTMATEESIAGIWSDDLPQGLLWCTPVYGKRSMFPQAPTWSWVSMNGAIQAPGHRDMSIQVRPGREADVVKAKISWQGKPLTSPLKKVSLHISGRLQIARVGRVCSQGEDNWWRVSPVFKRNQKETFELYSFPKPNPPFSDGFVGTASFDIEPPEKDSLVTCLQIGFTHPQSRFRGGHFGGMTETADHWFLILQATGTKEEYRRIGMGYVTIETSKWGSDVVYRLRNTWNPPSQAEVKMIEEDLPNDGSWSSFSASSPKVLVRLV